MTSSQLKTIISGLSFAAIGCLISFWTGWQIVIPILFGLSIPIVNIDQPFRLKFALAFVVTLSVAAVLIAGTCVIAGFNMDKYIFPGIIVGIAAVLILLINGLVTDNLKPNIKTILLTFVLSGLTLPISIYFWGHVFGDSISDLDSRLHGIIFVWLTVTTLAISFGQSVKPTANTGP